MTELKVSNNIYYTVNYSVNELSQRLPLAFEMNEVFYYNETVKLIRDFHHINFSTKGDPMRT